MKVAFHRLRESPHIREAAGLVLMVIGLLCLGALFSYDAADSSWFSHSTGGGEGRNWFGWFGATLAETVLQLFGTVALLVPLVLGIVGWRMVRPPDEPSSVGRRIGYVVLGLSLCALVELLYGNIAYGGYVVLGLSLCALVELLYGNIAYGGERLFPAGGIVGHGLAVGLEAVFNRPGALLISATTLAAAVILTTRVSFVRTVELAVAGAARLGALLAAWVRSMAGRIRDQREASRERHEAQEASAAEERAIEIRKEPAPRVSLQLEPKKAARPAETVAPKKPIKAAPPKQARLPMKPGARGYSLPTVDLLNEPGPQMVESEQDLLDRARLITEKLKEFAVHGSVVAVHPGPVVTTFEFRPEAGVKYSKITGMIDDLSLALKAESVRIDRMPGRATVGIEVPNQRQETIYPRQLMDSEKFRASDSRLTLALGKDISGEVFTSRLDTMPHLLIAGATGSGKSVGLNCMIVSLLFKATPEDLRFIMIDTKMIELGVYADIPHLLIPVVTEPKKASTALKWAVREMESRYRKLAATGVRNIAQFNELIGEEPDRTMPDPKTGEDLTLEALPYIVIVIDELADLMMVSSADVEESIMRLAQMARAVGIHLIIATQRPSVDVITGTIKANFPSRIAFRVSQRVDSRTIIDRQGAEYLLGRGDMLFLSSGAARLQRLHGGYLTEAEIHRVTAYIKKMAEPVYDESVLKGDEEGGVNGLAGPNGERDEMFEPAVRTVIQEGKCSITLIQRRLQLGYARAARIVDIMEREGIVSAGEGSKPREILVGSDYLEETEAAR